MWARGAVLALLLCGACVDGRSVGYPDELPEGTRALLLRVDLDGLGWAMFLRPDAPPTSIAVPTEGDLWMQALPFTPTDLLLDWEVPIRDVGASGGAALPPPLASFRRTPDEPWVQAEPPARPFFLPHVTFAACGAVGGCLTESDGLIQCLEPCPIPTVTPPAPPSRACPEGWGGRELEDAVFCAPPLEARAACGAGERQPVGGEACASVSTCAAGPWPDAEGGERVWYVRGGAVGGDGTPLDPYGTLAEAVAAARDGDQILLGAGTIPGAVEVARSVRIAGLCPRDSTLVGPMRVTGDVRMRDLRVVSDRGPGLEIAAGGALELVGAVVEATEVAVRAQGTLRLGPALVSAPVALDAAGDVALAAVSTQGSLRCTGGLLVADDLVATATSTIADLNGCTRAAFSRVRFEGGRLGVVSTRPLVVGIEDATFVQQSGVGVALEIPGELPGTLTATRVSFVGGGRGIVLRGVDAQLSDVHSEGLAGSTLDVNVPADVPESHQAVVARGVWVEGGAVPLVRSSRDAGDRRRLSMTLTDAVLHGTSTAHPLDGLLRGGRFAELNVQRAWVRTEGPPALWTSCSTGDIEDLTLRGSATDMFRLEPGQTISARRVRVEADSRGGGLFTATDSCEAGGVMVEDLEMTGACPPCGPSDPACRCVTGLEVRSQAAVRIRRSSVSGFNTGVHLFGLGPVLIEDSLVTANTVGIFAPTDLDLEAVLRRVVLDGNELGLQLY